MLKPEIITIEPIEVLAVRHIGAYTECAPAWEKLMSFTYTERMKNKKNLVGKNARRFGIGYDNPHTVEVSKLRYDACITKDDVVELPDYISVKIINGGKYARFLHVGAYEKLTETYQNIFCVYVVENNIELRDEPVFEEYLNKDPRRTKPENLKTLIYLPIV
ncbi:MAG: hypothetical protein RL154_628 [Pseudomonadota bacterium]|jgi:AraC family transcriptional regulator